MEGRFQDLLEEYSPLLDLSSTKTRTRTRVTRLGWVLPNWCFSNFQRGLQKRERDLQGKAWPDHTEQEKAKARKAKKENSYLPEVDQRKNN